MHTQITLRVGILPQFGDLYWFTSVNGQHYSRQQTLQADFCKGKSYFIYNFFILIS